MPSPPSGFQLDAPVAPPDPSTIAPPPGFELDVSHETPQEPPDAGVLPTISTGLTRGMLDIISMPMNATNAIGNIFLAADQKLAQFLGTSDKPATRLSTDYTRDFIVPALSGPPDAMRRRVIGDLNAGAGSTIGNISEFAGASVGAGGGMAALGRSPATIGNLVREGVTGVTAGLGSEAARAEFPNSPIASLIGAVIGGAGGQAALSGAAKQAARGDLATIQRNVKTLKDAGITDPTLATATGRLVNAVVERSNAIIPGAIGIMRVAGERIQAQAEAAVSKLTGGATNDAFRAGKAIDKGLFGSNGFVANFKNTSAQLYGKIDSLIPPDTRVPVTNTKTLFDAFGQLYEQSPEIAKVLTNPRMREIATAINAATVNGTMEYGLFKQVRSKVGELIGQSEIISNIPTGDLKRLYGAISEDMLNAAGQVSPEARESVIRANKYYSSGMDRIDGMIGKINGMSSPDAVFNWLASGNLADSTKLQTLKKSLDPDEWKIVRDTLLARMGKPRGDAEFSTETFMTRYGNMTRRSKDIVFGGDKQYEDSMQTLVNAFRLVNAPQQVLRNYSGTTGSMISAATIMNAVGGSIAAAVTGHPAAAAGIAAAPAATMLASDLSARYLMTSPKFVKWAATAAKVSPDKLPAELARLNEALGSDPQYSDELTEFNVRMAESLSALGKQATQRTGP